MDTQKKSLYVLVSTFVCLALGNCGLFVKHIPRGEIPKPTPNDHFVKVDDIQYHDRNRTENALDAQLAVIKAIDSKAFDRFIERVPGVTTPTLLIWGREDVWVPLETVGYRFKRDLSNALLVVIPECGHVPQEEYPEETVRLIRDFLTGRPIEETSVPEQK